MLESLEHPFLHKIFETLGRIAGERLHDLQCALVSDIPQEGRKDPTGTLSQQAHENEGN